MTTEMGYFFHKSSHSQGLGHPEFEANIYGEPTHRFFDPEKLVATILDQRGLATHLTLNHPWRGPKNTLQLCPGRIYLYDRKSESVEAFTLGGTMHITVLDDHTHCRITSTAPIMELVDKDDIEVTITSEFESLLAKARSQWQNKDRFLINLAQLDPQLLLTAGIKAMQTEISHLPHTPSQRQLAQALEEAEKLLKADGRWQHNAPNLNELVAE
jgi:hypothetical protein